jgi:uncharacterized protein (DUF2147 family)
MMKRLLAMAVVLLASSAAAQAQYQFEYGGRTIRIDPDRGTVSIPGVYDNNGRRSKRAHGDQNHKLAPQDAKAEPQAAPAAQAPADAATAPAAVQPAAPATAATVSPEPAAPAASNADVAALPPPPPAPAQAYVPPVQQDAAVPPPMQAPAPAVPMPAAPASQVAVQQPPAAPVPAPVARDPNSPLGIWLTEEKEGKVRIEECGGSLCGYSVDTKTNLNGEQVLINMKPSKDLKWSGRILDPNTGSTYDSTIAMKGSNTLRVQGCAFGGMFCGGQTWTRVN